VIKHALVVFALVTLIVSGPHPPLAVNNDSTCAAVGTVEGLQPKYTPAGTPEIVGATVLAVQVYTICACPLFPQLSLAVIVKVCVTTQPLTTSLLVTPKLATVAPHRVGTVTPLVAR
jgi:hypothetical protein